MFIGGHLRRWIVKFLKLLCLKFTLTYNNLINLYVYYTLNYNFCQAYITEWVNLDFSHIIDKNRSFNLFSTFCLYIVCFLSLKRCLHSCQAIYPTIDNISHYNLLDFLSLLYFTRRKEATHFSCGFSAFYIQLFISEFCSWFF